MSGNSLSKEWQSTGCPMQDGYLELMSSPEYLMDQAESNAAFRAKIQKGVKDGTIVIGTPASPDGIF